MATVNNNNARERRKKLREQRLHAALLKGPPLMPQAVKEQQDALAAAALAKMIDTETEQVYHEDIVHYELFGVKKMNPSKPPSPGNKETPSHNHPNPKLRLSCMNNRFPDSAEEDWTNIPHIGWVYKAEKSSLDKITSKCIITDTLYLNKNLYRTISPDGNTNYIHPSQTAKLNWFRDSSTGYYFPPEDAIEVCRKNPSDKVIASKTMMERSLRGGGSPLIVTCDYSKEIFLSDWCRRVHNSDKYGWVSNYALETSGLFRRCDGCEHTFEHRVAPRRAETGDFRCERCYLKAIKGQVILAHNARDYPKPICTEIYQLGHRIDKETGLVYATGKKALVPIVRLFGLEAEVEMHAAGVKKDKMNRISMAISVKESLGSDFVIIKEDGTLTMNGKYSDGEGHGPNYAGFEIVTAPADIAFHRARWNRLEKAQGYKHLRAWDTETCGFHIHVTRAALNNLQIGRILLFINHPKNQEFIHKIAGRGSDQFCKYYAKEFTDALHPERVISKEETDHRNRSRRVAVNLANPATIEFRIFRGTINPKHILRNLDFVDACCDYCYPSSRSLTEYCTHFGFIKFIDQNRKRWPYLADWFAYHKFIKIKDCGEKANRDAMTLKPHLLEEAGDVVAVATAAPRVEKPRKRKGFVEFNQFDNPAAQHRVFIQGNVPIARTAANANSAL